MRKIVEDDYKGKLEFCGYEGEKELWWALVDVTNVGNPDQRGRDVRSLAAGERAARSKVVKVLSARPLSQRGFGACEGGSRALTIEGESWAASSARRDRPATSCSRAGDEQTPFRDRSDLGEESRRP